MHWRSPIRRILSLLAVAAVAHAACRNGSQAAELPATPAPGTYSLALRSGGFDRVAHIHVPKGYRAGTKPPLVLALHGAGGDGLHMLDAYHWTTKADQEGFLVVAPTGLPALPRLPASFQANPHVWNSGQLRPQSPRARIDDVAFVGQLLDVLKERLPYDEKRVFVTGHSNGGGMTFRLGTEMPERLAALAPVASLMAVKDPKPSRPLPTLYIIGTQDPLQPLAGGTVTLPWGTRVNPPVAENLVAWAKAIGCESEPKTLSEKDGVKRVEYPSKSQGPTLTVIYIEGQGHTWPGAKATLPANMMGPITERLDATDTIWEFFQKCAPAR